MHPGSAAERRHDQPGARLLHALGVGQGHSAPSLHEPAVLRGKRLADPGHRRHADGRGRRGEQDDSCDHARLGLGLPGARDVQHGARGGLHRRCEVRPARLDTFPRGERGRVHGDLHRDDQLRPAAELTDGPRAGLGQLQRATGNEHSNYRAHRAEDERIADPRRADGRSDEALQHATDGRGPAGDPTRHAHPGPDLPVA